MRVSGQAEAVAFSNRYAPEHLIVNVEDAEAWLPLLDNAGSIFLGPWWGTGPDMPIPLDPLVH